nr:hypothetical protein [uncultured Moellerella sp.]
MSLMETFVQIFEFDTRQAEDAFKRIRRSSDEMIADMKRVQQAATEGSSSFSDLVQRLALSLQSLSLTGPLDIDLNINDTNEKLASVRNKISELKDTMAAVDLQRIAAAQGTEDNSKTIEQLNDSYKQLQNDLAALNGQLNTLTETEQQNLKAKAAIDAIVNSLHGDYAGFIETMRTQGLKAALDEIAAQNNLQDSLTDTQLSYREAANTVADFAQNTLSSIGLLPDISTLFSDLIDRAADIEALDQLGQKINVTAADIDAFSGVMASLGGTREAAQTDLAAMAGSFGFAGDSMEKILQTADQVEGMNFEQAKSTLAGFGVGDDKTIELMIKGRKELERMMGIQKDYSNITKESIEQSKKFNLMMRNFDQYASLLKTSFLDMIFPVIVKGMEWLTVLVNFAKENKHLVVGFFSAIAAILLGKYIHAMELTALSTWTAMLPILAIAAGLLFLAAVFALIYDDIMHFIAGNDSMIGRILEEYPALKTTILALWEAFKVFYDYLKVIVLFVAGIVVDSYTMMNEALNQFLAWLSASIDTLMLWGGEFEAVFNTVSDAVVGIFKWLWAQVKQFLDWINEGLDNIQKGWSTVKGWFGFEDNEVKVDHTVDRNINAQGKIEYKIPESPILSADDSAKLAQGLSQQIDFMSKIPMNSVTSQAISNQSATSQQTNMSIGNIKIETNATDAQGIVNDMNAALLAALQNFEQQMQTGTRK